VGAGCVELLGLNTRLESLNRGFDAGFGGPIAAPSHERLTQTLLGTLNIRHVENSWLEPSRGGTFIEVNRFGGLICSTKAPNDCWIRRFCPVLFVEKPASDPSSSPNIPANLNSSEGLQPRRQPSEVDDSEPSAGSKNYGISDCPYRF
jgi:hypothetical protein